MKSILSGSTIILVIVVCGLFMANGASIQTSNEKAIESVDNFMKYSMTDIIISEGIKTAHADYISLSNENSEFWVNANTFDVEGYLSYSNYNKFSEIKLSKEDAEKIALKFAIEHFKCFHDKDLKLEISELIDSGNMKIYHFTWREYKGDIEGPSVIDIVINPDTGDILSYIGINRDISIPLSYNISKDRAINSAIEQFKGINIQSIDSKMKIWYDEKGSQKLMWMVTIFGSQDYLVRGGTVSIDANSGEIIQVDEFL